MLFVRILNINNDKDKMHKSEIRNTNYETYSKCEFLLRVFFSDFVIRYSNL